MVETEEALIGAILIRPDLMSEVSHLVCISDFINTMAAAAFSEMQILYSADKPIDMITVAASGMVTVEYAAKTTDVGLGANAIHYAKDIASAAKTRRLTTAMGNLCVETNPSEILYGIAKLYDDEVSVDSKKSDIASVLDRFDNHVEENRKRGSLGLNTGISLLNDNMIYYVKSQVWTLAGYTSTGKTAMMTQKIVNLFRSNKNPKVLVISTEMTEEQMVGRVLGNMCKTYSQKILSGKLRLSEQEKYAESYKELMSWDLTIHDDIFELSDIEAAARKCKMKGGVDIVFIDYVQNCKVKGLSDSYFEQKTLAIAFQQLAKKIDATVICLSQVSNSVGRGQVDTFELKGAGEWAAVTDVGVMLIKSKVKETELLYSIQKNRHGAKSNVVFEYENDYSWLRETAEVNV